MRFSDIYAQDTAIRVLKSAIRRNSVAQAYLFTGPERCGKTSAALAFASALNCLESNGGDEACGSCISCMQIDSGTSPDVILIKPDGNQTKIEQMHSMIKDLNFAPVSRKYKVYIIEQADTLNTSSENSILKILEEPPVYAVLILLSSNPNSLLPTIRSRCQKIRFRKASFDEVMNYISANSQVAGDEQRVIAASSQGLIGRAYMMLSNPDFVQEREQVIKELNTWVNAPDVYSIRFAETLRKIAEPKKNDSDDRSRIRRLNDLLDYIMSWYNDLLVLSICGIDSRVINYDYIDDLVYQAGIYTIDRITKSIRSIMDTQRYLEGNITPQLALENLLFNARPDKV